MTACTGQARILQFLACMSLTKHAIEPIIGVGGKVVSVQRTLDSFTCARREKHMANDYAPKLFLRQAENDLLREYFAARSELDELDWRGLSETNVEVIYNAWQDLPDSSLREIDNDFRSIFDQASTEGTQTLIEEGRFHRIDLVPHLDARDGFLNKAFWVFLNHRRVFDVAYVLDRADHLNRRYWRKRKDVPKRDPDLSSRAVADLEQSISAYYRNRQGRGRHCHVDKYYRGGRYHYFFAYPQDYTDTFVGYDEEGKFERRRQSPAFEVIFVYDPIDGVLDLYAQGGKAIKKDLQELFGRTILHEELGEERGNANPYELNRLKRPRIAFPTDPTDRIIEVRIKELRLSVIGNPRNRITFEASPNGPPGEIHDLMRTSLHETRLPMAMVNVISAVLQVRFDNTEGSGRKIKTVTFRVSYPDSCNLKDRAEHLVVKKYLKLWKIERA